MKKLLPLLLLILIGCSDPYNGPYKEYYENGQLKGEGTLKDGKPHGSYVIYHENGVIKSYGTFKDGIDHGPFVFYNQNGKLVQEGTFKDGKEDGPWKWYHQNGQLESEGTYKYGKRDGLYKEYYDNGQLRLEVTFKDGKEDGLLKEYWDNGKVRIERTFKNGKENGPSKMYWKEPINMNEMLVERNGVYYTKDTNQPYSGPVFSLSYDGKFKVQQGEYKKGLKEGWWKFFSIHTEKTNISSGVVTSDRTYLKWEVFYENNKPIKYKELIRDYGISYHPDRYEEGFCSSELFEVWYPYSWSEYDDNTEEYLEKNTRITYFECKKSGNYKSFDSCYSSDNCKDEQYLFEEGFYKLLLEDNIYRSTSVKNGNFKRYYKSGELKEEGFYLNGEERGPYKIYYKDGKVREEGSHS